MAELEKRSLDQPDETRAVDKGSAEVVELEGATVMRTTFQPGWRWSESVKPMVGTDSCQVHHVGYVVSGRMHVRMDDGEELEIGPGDVLQIPPPHDAWIVGEEAYVGLDFAGGAEYAKT
jgi:quercetin dioxygenase-like cupin family protein